MSFKKKKIINTNKKILHVSGTFDSDSSTTSAIYLHEYLKKNGYDSKLAFFSNNKNYIRLNNSFFQNLTYRFKSIINNLFLKMIKKNSSFAFFNDNLNSDLKNIINEFRPDILHIHWLPRSITLSELSKLNIKIVWTIRDFWAFTGGCNVPLNCNKYLSHCKQCPHLILNFEKDISFYNFKSKKQLYKKLKDIYITFPCTDFKIIHKKSILNIIKNNLVIPNTFDSRQIYKVKAEKRKKFTVGFGAQNLDQEWKGMHIVKQLIEKTKNENIDFVIFGKSRIFLNFLNTAKNVRYLKYIYNKKNLRTLLSSFNVLLFPSLYESFGKIILESLACGTPVISRNAFGAKDILTHGKDGYLVKKNTYTEYMRGIKFFQNKNLNTVSKNCINKSKQYTVDKIAPMFETIYKKL